MRSPLIALLLLTAAPVSAQSLVPDNFTRATPAPKIDTIPPARDIAFPGTLQLRVDATDLQRRIFRVHETIPVQRAGDFVLLYPKWLPGNHAPSGQIGKVAGLTVTAGTRRLNWVRDTLDVYAFHIDVPAGVRTIDVDFQYVSPTDGNQGRTVMTPELASIQWIANSLYPAGYYVRNIPVQASVKIPQGWQIATALRPASGGGTSAITYKIVPYDVLVDSPALAGAYFRK
jgi:predicted metalloprotease with PDZ domain